MLQKICAWLLYKKMGWSKKITIAHPDKCIICLAPHTSNWDFIIGLLYSRAESLRCSFLMKKEWFFPPLGFVFKSIGGIPVHRSKNMSMTDILAEQAINTKKFRICITPEGTRSLNKEWKHGFYFIAYKAQIPILLYGLDYDKKNIVCNKSLIPNGNIETEIKDIKSYFKGFTGKYPEKFSIGNLKE